MQALFTNIALGFQAYGMFPVAFMFPLIIGIGVLPFLGMLAGMSSNFFTQR